MPDLLPRGPRVTQRVRGFGCFQGAPDAIHLTKRYTADKTR